MEKGTRKTDVTLVLKLTGRHIAWDKTARFLSTQLWPRDCTRLILVDTGKDEGFSQKIRRWLAESDYPHFQFATFAGGPNSEHGQDESVRAGFDTQWLELCAKADTEYLWFVGDEVIPAINTCAELLRAMKPGVGSVSAVYPAPDRQSFMVWNGDGELHRERSTGIEWAHGHGIGCTIIRQAVVTEMTLWPHSDEPTACNVLFEKLKELRLKSRINWSVICERCDDDRIPRRDKTPCECDEPGLCPRHNVTKSAALLSLCKNHYEYFRLWEQGRGPSQKREVSHSDAEIHEPSLARKAVNFSKAIGQHILSGRPTLDDYEVYKRLEVCAECEYCDTERMVCKHQECGCRLLAKARWKSSNCPLAKWPSFGEQDANG